MFWMLAYPLGGQVGGGWALEIGSFLGFKWQGPKNSPFPGPNPLPLARNGYASTPNIMQRDV